MEISRRDIMKILGVSATSMLFRNMFAASSVPAVAAPRMPLEEFVQDSRLLTALRKGVKEMKLRKPSDPLSWFFQAAIHGVTDEAIKKAIDGDPKANPPLKGDPLVSKIFKKRYWNQCPHDGENSANFLPWHRGYTYYFE